MTLRHLNFLIHNIDKKKLLLFRIASHVKTYVRIFLNKSEYVRKL